MSQTKVIKPHVMPLGKRLWRDRYLYLLLIPVIAYYFIFKYVPFYGIQMGFKDFNAAIGVANSPWVGLSFFERLFSSPFFYRVFRNTLVLNILNLIFGFPAPIILALMLNEMHSTTYKRITQSI